MAFLIGGANSAADTGYNVDNSIRFNGPDNSNLTQTSSGTPTNRRKCTVSFWIKHDCKSGNQCLIQGTDDSGANSYFQFELTDVGIDIQLRDGSGATYIRRGTKGKRIFRDPSAWYHFVVRFDSTEGSAGDRFRVYINGTQDPLGGSDDTGTVDSNYDFVLTKDSMPIAVGSNVAGGGDWSGYMAELVCIDGDSLAPTSFGEFDEDSPTIWKPIDVSGLTFGTNGFYCDFEDSGDLGDDESGNTNDFTENNLAAADQAVDTPTNNFATLNPLIFNAEAPTFSEGNCKFVATAGSNFEKTTGTIAVSTGKWYWEAKMAATLTAHFVGVQTTNAAYDADEPMYVAGTTTFKNNDGGEIRTGASETTADYGTFDATEIFGIALDMTAGSYGQFTIYKDNSAIASNIDLSSTTGDGFIAPFVAGYNSTIEVNFGGCPAFTVSSAAADANGYGTFEFAPPSGYYALCTKNLAKYGYELIMAYTTIDNPELYFQTVLYGGNNSTQSITLGGDEDMQPDLVWIKARSDAGEHTVYDSVRGATKRLDTADNGAEDTVTNGVTAFNSDGFSLGAGGNENSATTIVAWCWKESATAGFDIVSYTGNSTNRTIAHSLSAVPHMMIVKTRSDANEWGVYHQSIGNTKFLNMNKNDAIGDDAGYWNDTTPTSSVFTVGTGGTTNANTITTIAYLFAPIQGYSKFGSYKGNANANGTFVHVGFRPAFVLLKNSTGGNGWEMRDNKRPGYNYNTGTLAPSSSDAETTGEGIDIFSNGFKLRASGNGQNGDNTYMYMAFAEAPFVNSNGVPCNAR